MSKYTERINRAQLALTVKQIEQKPEDTRTHLAMNIQELP